MACSPACCRWHHAPRPLRRISSHQTVILPRNAHLWSRCQPPRSNLWRFCQAMCSCGRRPRHGSTLLGACMDLRQIMCRCVSRGQPLETFNWTSASDIHGQELLAPNESMRSGRSSSGGTRERAVRTAQRAVGKRPSKRGDLPERKCVCYSSSVVMMALSTR